MSPMTEGDRFLKTTTRVPILTVSLVLAALPVLADEANRPERGQQDDFSWSAGVGVLASPRPYKETGSKVFPVPVLSLRYKRIFVRGIRGGFDLVQSRKLTASVFVQPSFHGLEPENSPFLEGMLERRKSLDAGAEVAFRGRPVGFRMAVVSDVLGRSKGQEVSLLAVSGAPLGKLGFVSVGIGPRWTSASRVDYYYGVRQEEARADRPAYRGRAAWSLDLNVNAALNLTSRLSLLVLFNREQLGSAIADSPLVGASSAYGLVTSLTYGF